MKSKKLWKKVFWRMIINWSIVVLMALVLHYVTPVDDGHVSLAVMATILGLLAAGTFTAYSSLSVESAPKGSVGFYNAIDVMLFCSMYFMLYLSMYCLFRIGIISAIGQWVEVILHISIGIMLSVMHFVDVWDRVQNNMI